LLLVVAVSYQIIYQSKHVLQKYFTGIKKRPYEMVVFSFLTIGMSTLYYLRTLS